MNKQIFISFLSLSSITFGSIFSLSYRMIPPSSAGAALGFVNFIGSIGALSFPAIFGYLSDKTQSFAYPFTFIAGMAVLALPCVLVWSPA